MRIKGHTPQSLRDSSPNLGEQRAVILLVFSFYLLVCSSCSTQKATWANIRYHDVTTHYNIWWNGNESLKKAVAAIEKNTKDDYTRVLPVMVVGTKESNMAQNPDLDRAIEKGIKGVKKHSIFVDGREHVPHIADCYLLTSYATFYKHDFSTTANSCQMIIYQYGGTAVADEAAVLMARCSTMEKRYTDAENALDELVAAAGKGSFDKHQRLGLYLAMAECTLPQEKYKKAVQFLKMALDEHPSREQKARIYFILGQIYQQHDKRPTATKYYQKVLTYGPSYEMEFNTRLNLASCADLQHTDRAKLERLLDRMIKEKKNEEFLDQIYYARGEMLMGFRETKKACDDFRKSVALSRDNPAQKARSALRLGGILYDRYQDYDQAQLYYDTALAIIKSDYPHYATHKARYDVLTSLVSYTRAIEANDSLIAVANMPEAKRMQFIQDKIEQLKKAEEEAKERELMEQLASDSKAQMNTLQGDWYFYNSKTVQQGKETFRQRWGTRILEDYWFLSNKGMLGMNMLAQQSAADNPEDPDNPENPEKTDNPETADESDKSGNPDDPHDVAYYLKNLPATQAEQDSLQRITAVSLLNAGYIYYDGIHNLPKAMECYLRMAEDYTTNPEIVQAFYMLYKIYDKQGNTPSSNYYRNMVLMGFPDSDFANLILDEDYFKEILRRSQLIREDYEEVYNLYTKRRYGDVVHSVAVAKELYEGNPMLGKFRYWEGLAYARMDNKRDAVATFRGIVKDYPETDSIVALAQAQLDYLLGEGGRYIGGGGDDEEEALADSTLTSKAAKDTSGTSSTSSTSSLASSDELPPEAQLFRYRENMTHYVLILINNRRIRATEMQMAMGDFNSQYYANAGYRVSPLMFTDTTQMLTVNRFKNAQEALDYCHHLARPESPLSQYGESDFTVFAISTQNYATFYNRKRVDAYKLFYQKYYKD
ncbi:MAG: tetratricopeptide repeat protein [Bacteroidales bacterium]|nr:tetratricopeptide repeat protein [Bacteroidales bacterium]